ncbi:MAG: nucleotide exchange factor GrpE [Pseudomonadota bacterium]
MMPEQPEDKQTDQDENELEQAQEGSVIVEDDEDVEQALQAAHDKAEKHWEMFVRSQAEIENVKRRAEKDLESAHKFALEKFSLELLAVKDSLELGLSSEDADANKLREGTELTLKMLTQAMEKFNIQVVDPVGEAFDPNVHQAMTMQETSEYEPNTVISVMQKGYLLNDRLLRPAMVVVAKASA